MQHNQGKVDWCLKKAKKELEQGIHHRGLVQIPPNPQLADAHIRKAEHNLNAITAFKRIGYSDWSAVAAFYSIYHCFLAIITKFGYESRNQECTFALINHLMETEKISLAADLVREVYKLQLEQKQELPTIIEIREIEQYGISISLEEKLFERLLHIALEMLGRTKEILLS
ncbi:MAG: hypothetical protein V1743_04840 [Nanoarchaeota archaeon]